MKTIEQLETELESERKKVNELSYWLRFCLNNCDDSAEHNFGTEATAKMVKLLEELGKR